MALERRDIEHFMNQARIKLPGSSEAGLKIEFYDVCKEFLSDSNAWVEHLHLPVIAGQQEYRLNPKQQGQIIRLVGVFDGNRTPIAAVMPNFGEIHIRWPIQTTSIAPASYEGNPWSATNPWLVVVNLNVVEPTTKDDYPVVPSFLLGVYSVPLMDGLLGKMMGQQSKTYSNTAMSLYHLRRFRAGIHTARTAAVRQNVAGAQNWRYPGGWGTHTQRGGVSTGLPTETF